MTKKPRGKPFARGNQVSVAQPGPPGGALLEQHVQAVFQRMLEGQGPVALWQWCADQQWSKGHTATVLRMVREQLGAVTKEKAEETRARLLMSIEQLIPKCRHPVLVFGSYVPDLDSAEGKEIVRLRAMKEASKDPRFPQWDDKLELELAERVRTCPKLYEIDHRSIQKYIDQIMRMTGIDKVVVEHRVGERPYREMSTAELRAKLAQIDDELAEQATPVETTTKGDEHGR